jgi:uncharacterized membrane protein YfcA
MHLILLTAAVGPMVGLMVGPTGVGASAGMKVLAAWSYHRKNLVDMRLALRMAIDSVPGAASDE